MSKKTKPAMGEDTAIGNGAPAAERNLGNARNRRMRLRAAWMYFIEEMTQNEIAQHLGVGRVTVVRLLSDARERREIKFSIESGLPECVGLERELEQRFGLSEAVVVPLVATEADATKSIGASTGLYLSNFVRSGMKIGVGWGRTLWESLRYIQESPMSDMSVVSLLGGITRVKHFNPSEFSWRFSNLFQAECYLMPAPAIVDTPQTRQSLIEHCGLGEGFERAKSLDAVLLSVGHLAPSGTAYRDGFVADHLRRSMIGQGAVGEVLFHYFDAQGRLVEHPIHDCVMAAPVSTLQRVPQRIVASGGLHKAEAMLGALRLVKPTVLITDEAAATRIIELDRGTGARSKS
ncbi:sugar-binding transcriptional regulator [Verminephrobacter eiseniae]|uniref:sugar-binding transcriptional regulator n=1 Tax=Verminephrobacter eiseniae TaxID=364317 RepID=UPI002237CC8A|nr:sugar-binding transcriptional regulator [Verminephrobacter eiseniae]